MNESQKFIKLESISSKLLLSATLLALLISNSPFNAVYYTIFHQDISVQFGHHIFKSNLLFWINDALMSIFFLVVGLEIKYEIVAGSLNSFRKAVLPAIAAVGGMVVPGLIYILFNFHDACCVQGWAIPTATDIAFALAILSLHRAHVPYGLKSFLTTLAVLDDLAAICIIAIFYSHHISLIMLALAGLCVFVLIMLNRLSEKRVTVYLVLGIFLWICLLKSGIHSTLAGVILAFAIPIQDDKKGRSPLQKIQNALHPWVALGILPLFAFANAGVPVLNALQSNFHLTIFLGIVLGLFIGKQVGVFTASYFAVKCGLAALPNQVTWGQLYAVAVVCGIGFTISLFIATLAFGEQANGYLNSAKMAVLCGSILSGVVGHLLLLKKRN